MSGQDLAIHLLTATIGGYVGAWIAIKWIVGRLREIERRDEREGPPLP